MNEQIKQLAFRVGIGFLYGDNSAIKSLGRFAELVRADEREACAKLCDDLGDEYEDQEIYAAWCAKSIRARGNT